MAWERPLRPYRTSTIMNASSCSTTARRYISWSWTSTMKRLISDTENSRRATVIFPVLSGAGTTMRGMVTDAQVRRLMKLRKQKRTLAAAAAAGNGREDGTQVREGREATQSDAQVPALADPSRRLWSGVAGDFEDSGALADDGGEDAVRVPVPHVRGKLSGRTAENPAKVSQELAGPARPGQGGHVCAATRPRRAMLKRFHPDGTAGD